MFDDARLDDEDVLALVDARLRHLAGSGARVRRDAGEALDAARTAEPGSSTDRPRAVVVVGRDAAVVRTAVEHRCPVPVVAWAAAGLPGWAGGLDLVVALDPGAPDGDDGLDAVGGEADDAAEDARLAVAVAVAEAVRRGARVLAATPQASLVARHAVGRDALVLPCESGDPVARVVVVLEHLHRLGLGPRVDADAVADALDDVARAASPHRDLSVNPAKALAVTLADVAPLVWGASALERDAADRVAGSLRRVAARPALSGDVATLLPVLEQARPRDLFADPVLDGAAAPRPVLVVLGDDPDRPAARPADRPAEREGDPDPGAAARRDRLERSARERGVRIEVLSAPDEAGGAVPRWAVHGLLGRYAAAYLALGVVED